MRSYLGKLVRGTSGQEIIEAAVVLPLLFMILFGIYWFGRAFNIYGSINHAAREGARVAIQTCASCTQLSKPLFDAQVAAGVTQALQASNLDPAKAQNLNLVPAGVACPGSGGSCSAIDLNGGPGKVRLCRSVQLNAGSPDPPVCGVVVSFQYPYQFWFPFTSLNKQSILLKADVQADGEE